MSQRHDSTPHTSPEELFASWLARRPGHGDEGVEQLCRSHPDAADRLRHLHGQYCELEELKRRFGMAGSVAERLTSKYGSELDPKVELQGEEHADVSSNLLGRLSGRTTASSRYTLMGEVAKGGMGAILRVWDEDLRRHLAMKVVLSKGGQPENVESQPEDRRLLARFLEEAQITGQLDHPGIVPVHELGLDAEGRVYFTMKLVKGRDFKAILDLVVEQRDGWNQIRALGVLLKVCEAMSFAHDKGVIHRDLKPANIMVGKFGEVYVMDWGLARILGREDAKDLRVRSPGAAATSVLRSDRRDRAGDTPDSPLYTMDGDVVGTPAYMSPEQAAGRIHDMGPQSDVYALGAMLYHLLTGHAPFMAPGARLNNYAVWQRVQEGPPKPLHEVAPRVPIELVAICDKAMARDPKSRYANTSQLAGDLSAYLEGRVVRAYETGTWAETRKWVKRNRGLASACAAAVSAIAVGGIGFALKAEQATKAALLAQMEATRADTKTREAERSLTHAQRMEQEATTQRQHAEREKQRAEAETVKVLRLSDLKVLQDLDAEADALWPPYPGRISALEDWMSRARALAARLPIHRATLVEMRRNAREWSDEERAKERNRYPRASELADKQAELAGLIAKLDQGLNGDAGAKADARVAVLEPEIAAIVAEADDWRTWRFDTTQEEWQHELLAQLVQGLESLETGMLSESGTIAGRGWSIPRRLTLARELQAAFDPGGEHAQAWAAALPAIRVAYPEFDLTPQMGLLPIGPDPSSGLWEFAHLLTGAPAERATDGKLILSDETGVVLVLLRGGTFYMGAQGHDPSGINYDVMAKPQEGPVHAVTLSPYFISKFEMTQGQWKRVAGHNPSQYGPDGAWGLTWLETHEPLSLLHPVEQVSWLTCMTWLPRVGLTLPSEAQWEYSARGGTSTPCWTGFTLESMRGAVNLADAFGARSNTSWTNWETELDDGAAVHAAVGTYRANAFGLHEIAGNLLEWCMDGFDTEFYQTDSGPNPVRSGSGLESRVFRGGGYITPADRVRSASRDGFTASWAGAAVGVRPACAVAE
jgi:serine/threonine protein kinase/formylglycine-generating enzyme required for sulfatase activity